MTKDEFQKRLPWLKDEEIKQILPSLVPSLTQEELKQLADEHLRVRLEQLRNYWIEASGNSEEEVRDWEAKFTGEILLEEEEQR